MKNFVVNMLPKCMKIAKIEMATMFSITNVCEITFSKMNFLMNQHRSKLTDAQLENTLCINSSSHKPNNKKLAHDSKCHLSHYFFFKEYLLFNFIMRIFRKFSERIPVYVVIFQNEYFAGLFSIICMCSLVRYHKLLIIWQSLVSSHR